MASTTLLDTLTKSVLARNLSALFDTSHNTNISAVLLSTVSRLLDRSSQHTTIRVDNWQSVIFDHLSNFFTYNPAEQVATVCALLTLLYLLVKFGVMSWLRFGNLDRFSPFTRSPPQGSTTVSDADFSYITSDDLKRHGVPQQSSAAAQADLGPPRDTDSLSLRSRRGDFVLHFPTYSIAKGELRTGQVRDAAAKRLNIDPRKVKLLYKGRNLKDYTAPCREEGLKDGSELLCTVADASPSDTDASDGEGEDTATGVEGGSKKKKNRNRFRRKKKNPQQGESAGSSLHPPTTEARAPSPASSMPTTAVEKIAALHATLRSYEQDVQAFIRHPPTEPAKREFEHKRLSETILAQVLLKTDAVETEGDADARSRRKELVKECQGILAKLDASVGVKE